MPLIGRGQMEITIGHQTFMHDVWVGDIAEDAILGLDFMKRYSCQLYLERGVICINGDNFELAYNEDIRTGCCRIVAKNMAVIPPKAGAILQALLCGCATDEGSWIIEPIRINVPKVVVGKVLTCCKDGLVPVRVMNLANRPRKIKKGTYLARGDMVNLKDIYDDWSKEDNHNANDPPEVLPVYLGGFISAKCRRFTD